MGFIEKMLGVRDEAPETPAANPGASTTEPEQAGTPAADEAAQESTQQPKSYTSEELEAILDEKKKEWREEMKAEEQERIRNLPEAERLKLEQLSKDDEISRLQAEISRRDLQTEVIAKLDAQRLPVSIAELVQYGDKDSTMQSLDKIVGVFNTAVLEGVNNRLRGKKPEGLGPAANRENITQDPFTQTFSDAFKK